MPGSFTAESLPTLCDQLAGCDEVFGSIISQYGYPPFWSRSNNFETLVHIILEQQVSLASARAALEKLRGRIGTITPENLLTVGDDEFTGLYISRQKRTYIQHLARELLDGTLDLTELTTQSDKQVERRLLQLPGIGRWTVSIYLIMVLHRIDRFPYGDVAALTALRQLKELPRQTDAAVIEQIVDGWQPRRTIAALLLWHQYLSERGRSY